EQVLGQKRQRLDVHGQLAGAGAEQVPLDADEVAEVEIFPTQERLGVHGVGADVDLEARTVLQQMAEASLAVGTEGDEASCNADLGAGGVQMLGGRLGMRGLELGQRVAEAKPVRVGIFAAGAHGGELGAPLVHNLKIEGHEAFIIVNGRTGTAPDGPSAPPSSSSQWRRDS